MKKRTGPCPLCNKPRKDFKIGKRGIHEWDYNKSAYCGYYCHMVAAGIKARCHSRVWRLIRYGALDHPTKLRCVDCGARAAQYDHRDYTHSIDVEPVCRSCNLRRGPGLYSTTERFTAPFFCPDR